MSLFTSVRQQAANITQKALRLGGDFAHPIGDDSSNGPDYAENDALAANGEVSLPNTAEWGPGYPTTTLIDSTTGLLTTKTEGNPPLDEGMSIYDIYADRAERMGDEPLYTYKDDSGKWVTSTANETLADIRSVAKGLLHYGLKKGDGVAFMCRTSYAWDVTDAAVMACGGVLATIYDTDSAEQIRNIVNNSDARLLIVGTADMRDKAEGAIEECPSLETILCIETGGLEEIKAYGTAVFPKYHKNEEATEGSFTDDGWYRTGDLGRLDNDGFLYITGRKKDLIITAGGKNVAPGPIEEVIQRCEFVSQVLVLGDKRPFISALVTLDEESLRPWLESKGLNRDMTMEEAASNAAVRAEVQKWVDQANEGVSRAESVRKFIILPEEFSQANGLLTASMKVIRPKVIRRYATLLNTQMYTKKK